MKEALKTVLRAVLWLILIVVVCGGVYYVCLVMDIPKKTALACVALLLALLLCFVLVRRLLARRHRRLQIQHIVTLDSKALRDTPQDKRLIDNRWQRAMAILRSSYLGRWGNPLYALPWHMVMGRTGAGKSSAVSHSGLNAMLTDVGPDSQHASTLNCDWYFFREAVVLDTAGRYAVPLDDAADNAEWREFLLQLAKYRRREPLNGLVIAVAADTLYGGGEHLIAEARCLRRRVDEIMRILGAKFPVYLMVTKLDLLAGMARILEEMPADFKRQSVGEILQSPDKNELVPVSVQIERALDRILEGFRSLCLYTRGKTLQPQPHHILAWEELKAARPALTAYAEELFAENPYQETPLLRGIFFSSALRADAQGQSRAFPGLDAIIRRLFRVRENVGGLFLHDFFSRVLPADRNLNNPIAEYLRWRSSVRAVAYGAMLLLTFACGVMFLLSFQHNATLLKRMLPPTITASDTDDTRRLLAFEQRFRDTRQMESEVNTRGIPTMGLNQARDALANFNGRLNAEFERNILTRAEMAMQDSRGRITSQTPDKDFFTLAADLVWRFDLASAARQGKNFNEMLQIPAMPQGILQALHVESVPPLMSSVAYSVTRYYYNQTDRDAQAQALRNMRAALSRLPDVKANSLHWLVHRASELSGISPLTGEDFWTGAAATALSDVRLDPAYTKEGFMATMEYLNNLSLIVSGDELPSAREFPHWYAETYVEAWKNFASAFVTETQKMATASVTSDRMTLMSSENNPYFTFALRMEEELRPVLPHLQQTPPWVDDLALWTEALRLERSTGDEHKPTMAQNLRHEARKLLDTAREEVDTTTKERDERAELLVKEIRTYLTSLHDLLRFTLADDLAFNAVQDAMPDEKNTKALTAPLNVAKTAALSMRQRINAAPAKDSPVLSLSGAPLSFFTAKLINSASCRIQTLWEGRVLAQAGAVSPLQLQQVLFAEQGGLARDFADKTLTYLLEHTLHGYQAEKLDNAAIPFTDDFLHFLNAGLFEYKPVPKDYSVTVNAVPVDVNDEALEKPYAVVLTLSCTRDKQELINYNSPTSRVFSWKSEGCGDTSLSIRFKTVTLDVAYEGENGFVRFLHDFQFGAKNFTPADFPGKEALLKKLGVTDIALRYNLTGADAILRGVNFTPGALPFVAAECRR
jgi:type VI secretion system protein ImpL